MYVAINSKSAANYITTDINMAQRRALYIALLLLW